jgi:hypothetical protein
MHHTDPSLLNTQEVAADDANGIHARAWSVACLSQPLTPSCNDATSRLGAGGAVSNSIKVGQLKVLVLTCRMAALAEAAAAAVAAAPLFKSLCP